MACMDNPVTALTGIAAPLHDGWTSLQFAAWAVLVLPLLSFLVNGLWLGRKHARAAGWTAALLMGATAVSAIIVALGWRASTYLDFARYESLGAATYLLSVCW
jgi:hypothetical protein